MKTTQGKTTHHITDNGYISSVHKQIFLVGGLKHKMTT